MDNETIKGRIKVYKEDKYYGFIIGEDGNDYFFHFSDVRNIDEPVVNSIVEFEPSTNSKGRYAVNIRYLTRRKVPAFVDLGNVRIKVSNIKNYGIADGCAYWVKVYQDNVCYKGFFDFKNSPLEWYGLKQRISEYEHGKWLQESELGLRDGVTKVSARYRNENGRIVASDHQRMEPSDLIAEPCEYLYVKTFQNENYKFFAIDVSFDVREKCKEMDEYLCNTDLI